ncbi:hypothetical protein C1645_882833 [Glomus cerebriforme]|uniref:Uncharacterized protein n=1 Tax=Glomus cerebriforme TaxID=658196 RepID=A0A397S0M2_9GLOM|nr:hypothetical protein C1645_882833 [Glomus cerebriforme]
MINGPTGISALSVDIGCVYIKWWILRLLIRYRMVFQLLTNGNSLLGLLRNKMDERSGRRVQNFYFLK